MARRELTGEFSICPVLNGMWQVSGAHGRIDPQKALSAMFRYVDAGLVTWDLADHYGPAEDLIGEFRSQWQKQRPEQPIPIQALTKWVPRPMPMTKQIVSSSIQISLQRMRVECLDALQFHWWDYSVPAYMDALKYMVELQTEGKIKYLALTNFDTEHLGIILDAGIPIISNQVQFSAIDRRPEVSMVPFCREKDVKILAYGTLCGGLLSEKYLGKPEPRGSLDTASLRKYKNMIDVWGGWALFQDLLTLLRRIADKHSAQSGIQFAIPHVAARYILDKPQVAGVIIGARLSISEHIEDNLKIFALQLDDQDRQAIDSFQERARNLYQVIGDCGDEYRR